MAGESMKWATSAREILPPWMFRRSAAKRGRSESTTRFLSDRQSDHGCALAPTPLLSLPVSRQLWRIGECRFALARRQRASCPSGRVRPFLQVKFLGRDPLDRGIMRVARCDHQIAAVGNGSLHILSLMTAFLLPPSLVTGFFGMNTSSLPFAEGIGGMAYAVGFIRLSVAAAWWALRRAGILSRKTRPAFTGRFIKLLFSLADQ